MRNLKSYLNLKKELKTTRNILEKLRGNPKITKDYAKDYSSGFPHTIEIEGFDVVNDYKIHLYEEKEKRLIQEIEEALNELTNIINSMEDPIAKTIFEYRYMGDMRFEEIAVKTNNSYENVRQIHYRTIKKLSQNVTKNMV